MCAAMLHAAWQQQVFLIGILLHHTHIHTHSRQRECTHHVTLEGTNGNGTNTAVLQAGLREKYGKALAVLLLLQTQHDSHPKQPPALANQRKVIAWMPAPWPNRGNTTHEGHEPAHPKQPRAVSHKLETGWLSIAQGTLCKNPSMPAAAAAHQPQQLQGVLSRCCDTTRAQDTRHGQHKTSPGPIPEQCRSCTKTAILLRGG